MNPEHYKKRKRHTKDDISVWVYKSMDLWLEVLQMENWSVDIRFDCHLEKTYAAVDVEDAEYETIEISFNTSHIRKKKTTEAELDDIVLHELMHARIAELAQRDDDHSIAVEERTVQNLVRALKRARQVGTLD